MTKKTAAWVREQLRDPYVRQAHSHGYRSRAAYKLLEMDQESGGFLRPGLCVVDLGAAPGSWSQVVSEKSNDESRIVAVDRLPMAQVDKVTCIQGDFTEPGVVDLLLNALGGRSAGLVLSDMAPNLSGNRVTDLAQMSLLHGLVLDLAERILGRRGVLLMKAFEGDGLAEIRRRMAQVFRDLRVLNPRASRSRSSEVYLLGRNLRQRGVAS